jgi:30S ribosomal protein S31
MGKGDKKSKRGKIVIGSHGVRRAKKKPAYKPVPKTETVLKADKSISLVQTPINKDLEVKPASPVLEVAENVAVADDHATKAKKATTKKSVEKDEDAGEVKPKATKTKKKSEGESEDLFTEKPE